MSGMPATDAAGTAGAADAVSAVAATDAVSAADASPAQSPSPDPPAAATGPFDDERFDVRAAGYARLFIRHLELERNLSSETVRAYAADLRGYLDWAARSGNDPLSLDHRRFRRYLVDMDRAGYARRTESRHLSAVRGFFSYLNMRGLVDVNPAAAAATPKTARELPRVTAAADLERLLSVCDTDDARGLRDQAFLELLYASGARIAELAGLAVGDLDFAAATLRLFGKGSKERIVPLYELALSSARAYLERARPSLLARGPLDAFFVSTRGNAMTTAALRRVFKERAAQAGLDLSLHPHDIRHAFATELVENGADLRSVQEMLGHASLSTTQIYANLSLEHMKDVYKRTHPRA